MPLTVQGAIRDDGSNFYAYSLSVETFGLPRKQFKPPYYYYEPAPPLMNDWGTVPPFPTPVVLGQLNILDPTVYGPYAPAGRYTVFLYAYDRSLKGWFRGDGNIVTDPFPGILSFRNWDRAITNFEYDPNP